MFKTFVINKLARQVLQYSDMDTNYIDFGKMARNQCGMQAQYCSRYLNGSHGCPNLGSGLRWTCVGTDPSDEYHSIKIQNPQR